MSTVEKRKAENEQGRVHVGTLSKQKEELKSHEARKVKGGGGLGGGVLADDPAPKPPTTTKPK
jgi:hypothetical protein